VQRGDPEGAGFVTPDDAHLREVPVASENIWQGRFLDVRRDTVELPNGRHATREYIVHPGAVMVVPIADDGRLVMERQFRHPMGRVMLEFPAGKIDPGEAPFTCAVRELAEETGYRAREWARAGILHNAIAYSTEGIEIWFARGLEAGATKLDAEEFLEIVLHTEGEIDAMAAGGQITDAKTLIGLLWLQKSRAGQWPLQWRAAPPATIG
jgi:ADP-ribose pyrophosphatase